MLNLTPEEVVAILRSARTKAPDPRLPEVTQALTRWWMAIVHKDYPILREQAEDVAVVVLGKVIQKIDQLEDNNKLEAWSRSILVRTALDFIRREQRANPGERVRPGKEVDDIEEWLARIIAAAGLLGDIPGRDRMKERLRMVFALVEELSANQQNLFKLKFLRGQSDAEVAKCLGLSNGRVRHIAMEIRQKLRKAVRDAE